MRSICKIMAMKMNFYALVEGSSKNAVHLQDHGNEDEFLCFSGRKFKKCGPSARLQQ